MKNPAKYLDKILEVLAENFGTPMTTQEIQNIITPVNIFGIPGNVTFGSSLLIDIQHAFIYLEKLDLISINPSDHKINLTFEGYIKIKTSGFAKEIRDKSVNKTLQRIAWIVPIMISILALFISLSRSPVQNNNKKATFLKDILLQIYFELVKLNTFFSNYICRL